MIDRMDLRLLARGLSTCSIIAKTACEKYVLLEFIMIQKWKYCAARISGPSIGTWGLSVTLEHTVDSLFRPL